VITNAVVAVIAVATSRVSRLPSDSRSTRSQSRLLNDTRPHTSATTTAAKGSKSKVSAAAAERPVLADGPSSMTRGGSRRGQSNLLSTKTNIAAGESEAKKSRRVARSAIETMDVDSVQSSGHVENMELSTEQRNQQHGHSPISVVQLHSSQKSKSAAHMDDRDKCVETKGGAGENMKEEDDVFLDSDHVADGVSSAGNHQSVENEADVGGSSNSNVNEREDDILAQVKEEKLCHRDESKPEVPKSFQSPGRSRKARSMSSPGITFASIRKTPKNLRNSLLLRRMSPEEGCVNCVLFVGCRSYCSL